MTDLIQTIARAMWDWTAPETEHDWRGDERHQLYFDGAQAAITALHDAGYAIVPREPTEAMLEAGTFEAECCTDDWTSAAACLPGHVYKGMIRAATTTGKAE
jgi:hypothetical protein